MTIAKVVGERTRVRWKAAAFGLGWAGLLLGWLHGCTQANQGPAATPAGRAAASGSAADEQLPEACEEVRHLRDLLADLGLQAMAAYGRLDAGLYTLVASAQPGDPERIEVAADIAPRGESVQFERALRGLNADENARRVLGERIRSNAAPTEAFAITVRQEDPNAALPPEEIAAGRSLSGEYWTWEATDSIPSPEQWQALLITYNYKNPECPELHEAFYLNADEATGANPGDKAFLGFAQQARHRGGRTIMRTDCGGSARCSGCGPSHDYVSAGGGVFCCGDLC